MTFPAWIKKLESQSKMTTYGTAIGLTLILSGVFLAATSAAAKTPITRTSEWEEHTKKYMKFQKMNPIFGNSN